MFFRMQACARFCHHGIVFTEIQPVRCLEKLDIPACKPFDSVDVEGLVND